MTLQNRFVAWLLQSPLHGVFSGGVDLVRYRGRRSGRTFTTPTQYARLGEDIVIMIGHPARKTWWRNFEAERDLEVLVRRVWLPMRGRVVRGADEPEVATALLDAYLARFPRAAGALGGTTPDERLAAAHFVWCRPR
jgi:hypothetical protein